MVVEDAGDFGDVIGLCLKCLVHLLPTAKRNGFENGMAAEDDS